MSYHKYSRSSFRVRLPEWMASFVLLFIGTITLLNPETLSRPTLALFFPSIGWWGWACLGVGISRIIALLINGKWRESPILRLFGSIVGACLFGAILGNLISSASHDPYGMSWGVGTYAVIFVIELFCSYFSASDLSYSYRKK